MARFVKRISIRTGEREPNFGPSVDGASGNSGSLGIDGNPRTGEPDRDDIQSASDDNQSSERVNGNGTDFVDPTTGTRNNSGASAGTGTRRRGRPPGSGGGKRATQTQTTSDLADLLGGIHYIAAKFLNDEIWMLSEPEAEKYAKSVTRLTELYETRMIPEKAMAWMSLTTVMAGIYGPRFAQASAKAVAKKKGKLVEVPRQQPQSENFGAD